MAELQVDSVVVTLGMTIIVAGIVTWATSGKSIVKDIPEALTTLSKSWIFGLPGAFFVALAFTIATWYLLRQTPYGRYLEAVGVNRSAARLVGMGAGVIPGDGAEFAASLEEQRAKLAAVLGAKAK